MTFFKGFPANFSETSELSFFSSKLEAGTSESREIGKLLELQLKSGLSDLEVIQNLQNSIANTDTQSAFICMYNRKSIELCHPNPAMVGKVIAITQILVYGKNQLKMVVNPKSEDDILISKNRVAEFKKWLEQ